MRCLVTFCLALISSTVYADLLDDIAARQGLSGSFLQQVFGEDDEVLGESRGLFAIRRPGLFRWEVTSPDRQLLVVDGKYLWQHDFDLETVIQREAPTGDASPLQLLTQTRDELQTAYTIRVQDDTTYLLPREPSDYFTELRIAGALDSEVTVSILDNLGQKIDLVLEIDDSADPPITVFTFTPPDGAEWLEGQPSL